MKPSLQVPFGCPFHHQRCFLNLVPWDQESTTLSNQCVSGGVSLSFSKTKGEVNFLMIVSEPPSTVPIEILAQPQR
ncbi:hypothetical protein ERO13_D10G118466v2 [Gossypium hirsutum]|uniref:Uncharacterized protein n=2 Tax=Gossypium TaxID=3633 RepID=A0A5J5PRS2_GOSBA|nr:hypothetical protein ES319_D10G129600v1 [Gossypium barbadense]KAG4125776.1 hypothetical protein ERO13_D10G118466v2 [Gossypium hirsutum]TYG49977.1 hypothetical protein ES288_D10G138200v1 [Gossypium darwinii]